MVVAGTIMFPERRRRMLGMILATLLVLGGGGFRNRAWAIDAPISFEARGAVGDELIGGLSAVTDDLRFVLMEVECEETGSGQLRKTWQKCTPQIASEEEVELLKEADTVFLDFENHLPTRGGKDRNIHIRDGQIFLFGQNIYRSAWDIHNVEDFVDQNLNGELDMLREGVVQWKNIAMTHRPQPTLWFEAKNGDFLEIFADTEEETVELELECFTDGDLEWDECVVRTDIPGGPGSVERFILSHRFEPSTSRIRGEMPPDRGVKIRYGSLFFFGVNVWWNAKPLTDEGLEADDNKSIWELRSGDFKASVAIVEIVPSDWDVDTLQIPDFSADEEKFDFNSRTVTLEPESVESTSRSEDGDDTSMPAIIVNSPKDGITNSQNDEDAEISETASTTEETKDSSESEPDGIDTNPTTPADGEPVHKEKDPTDLKSESDGSATIGESSSVNGARPVEEEDTVAASPSKIKASVELSESDIATNGGDSDEGRQCCFTVRRYHPYRSCKKDCRKSKCKIGWKAWQTMEECCAPGNAFESGCESPPKECYVVKDYHKRTCWRDDTKCFRGHGVWSSMKECCQSAFKGDQGCAMENGKKPSECWCPKYWPRKMCVKMTGDLCNKGSQLWETEESCCNEGFENGCDNEPVIPCYRASYFYPKLKCILDNDLSTCSRGWGVYKTREECCKKYLIHDCA